MAKPRYANAKWSLLVADLKTGKSLYALDSQRLSLTGSTRKLFSVGLALNTLGSAARQTTPVYRRGSVDSRGRLNGDLVLAAGGDLAFGGRRISASKVQYTHFDHNDANALGKAILTPQDPLFAVNSLARQVRAAGIREVRGNIAVDDRLFAPYRVPNGNLLISPMMLNENMVDVTVAPGAAGKPATVRHRPATAAFSLRGGVRTSAAGTPAGVTLSGNGRVECIGKPGCSGTIGGTLPFGYRAPLTALRSFVGTFRVEDPTAFARTAFVEALRRQGVRVSAPPVSPNPTRVLASRFAYPAATRVALHRSAPFAQTARLVLKVSLNLGANASLSLFGLTKGQRTVKGSLAAERRTLIDDYGVDGSQFRFPTNGSGTPDSQASPLALVQLLRSMSRTKVFGAYRAALPIMGVDGSLAHTGNDLPGKGHVFAKPGTTLVPGADGETLELKAQNLAGYIETRSGRTVAYALMVNDAGTVEDIERDVSEVFGDEGAISSIIYETL